MSATTLNKRNELDAALENNDYKAAGQLLRSITAEDRIALLKDDATSLTKLINILCNAYAINPRDVETFKKILFIIAYVIEESGFTAKFHLNEKVMDLFELIPDDDRDPSAQIIKEALKRQGADTVAMYSEEIVRFGHILGSKASIAFESAGNIYTRTSEGNTTSSSVSLLKEIIEEYRKTHEMTPRSVVMLERFSRALDGADQDLKIFPITFPGHGVYVAVFNGYLILSNRGDRHSDDSGGVKIFKIRPSYAIATTIAIPGNFIDKKDFENYLATIVDIKSPIKTFHEIKSQRHGNCSFVNAKALITPYLYLCLPDEDKQNSHDIYKLLTSWMRDREVDRLLDQYKLALSGNDKFKQDFYVNLLMRYAYSRALKNKSRSHLKVKQDVDRSAKILSELNEHDSNKTYVDLYLKLYKAMVALHKANLEKKSLEDIQKLEKQVDNDKTAIHDYFKSKPIKLTLDQNPNNKPKIEPAQTQSFFSRFVSYIKRIWNTVAEFLGLIYPDQHSNIKDMPEINTKKIKCTDPKLKKIIFNTFLQREQELAIKIEHLKKLPNTLESKLELRALRTAISDLQNDWNKFLLAKNDQELRSVAATYVEERKKVCPSTKKRLWIISNIFAEADESSTLTALESALKPRRFFN